jgi:hypothetical protein
MNSDNVKGLVKFINHAFWFFGFVGVFNLFHQVFILLILPCFDQTDQIPYLSKTAISFWRGIRDSTSLISYSFSFCVFFCVLLPSDLREILCMSSSTRSTVVPTDSTVNPSAALQPISNNVASGAALKMEKFLSKPNLFSGEETSGVHPKAWLKSVVLYRM